MKRQGTQLLVVLAVLTHGAHSSADMCRNAVAPPSKPRGVNQVDRASATPLFELDVTPLENKGNAGGQTAYKISISIEKGNPFRFNEATLAVSTNGNCGLGEFDFRDEDYVAVNQDEEEECPLLIQTKRKTHMTQLFPLIWIPPTCGCIQLRILVVETDKIYYAENEGTTNGPLAKMICFRQKEPVEISRDHRLESLCHVIDKHSSSEIMSRGQFRKHRELESRLMDHLGLEMALELRRNDAKICCSQRNQDEREKCFGNARRRRIDQFCEDGIPDIPFRTFRKKHMMMLEKSCCFILGEFRYKCFARNSELAGIGKDTTPFDYSMDASDVVNDLADFASHQHLDTFLRPIPFGETEDLDESVDGDESEEVEEESELDLESEGSKESKIFEKEKNSGEEGGEEEAEEEEEEEEEEEFYAADAKPNAKNTLYVQRPPPKKSNKLRNTSQTALFPPPTKSLTTSPTTLSQKELKRQMRRKSKSRNSHEIKRLSSAERKRARQSRRKSRRGSAEKRERTRKVLPQHSVVDDSYSRVSSRERGTLYKMDPRGRGRSTVKTTRGDRGGRRPMSFDKDLLKSTQYGFEDQGGSSMDRTLNKLQKRMKRLKLLNTCCKAGVDAGGQVYGGIDQVTDECSHSSAKFIRGVALGHKTKRCIKQFVDCCLEEAKKGLTMTSQEFIENNMVDYWDGTHQYNPHLVGQVLSQRGRRTQYPHKRPTKKTIQTPQIPNVREAVFDQRHDSLQKGRRTVPKSSSTNERLSRKQLNHDRRVEVPKRFQNPHLITEGPEQVLQKELSTTAPVLPKEGIENKRTNKTAKKMSSRQVEGIRGNPSPTRVVYVEFEELPLNQRGNRNSGDIAGNKRYKSTRKEINIKDFEYPDSVEDEEESKMYGKTPVKSNTKTLLTGRKSRNSQENTRVDVSEQSKGSSREEKQMSRKTQIIAHTKDYLKKPTATDLLNNSKTNLKNSGLSRNQDKNTPRKQNGGNSRIRSRAKQRKRNRYTSRRRSKFLPLDSREMAEKNTKQFMDALDSKEMADQYISNNKNNRKMKNWFRNNMKNYRHTVPVLSNRRRKFRFG